MVKIRIQAPFENIRTTTVPSTQLIHFKLLNFDRPLQGCPLLIQQALRFRTWQATVQSWNSDLSGMYRAGGSVFVRVDGIGLGYPADLAVFEPDLYAAGMKGSRG